jgi:hypothetical protein
VFNVIWRGRIVSEAVLHTQLSAQARSAELQPTRAPVGQRPLIAILFQPDALAGLPSWQL